MNLPNSATPSSFANRYRGRNVFVTGHTGFKGSWLTQWLLRLGARVSGFALDPETNETLFDQLGLSSRLAADFRADIRNFDQLHDSQVKTDPDFIFHLAAQPLVRRSFEQPVATFETNVMGTVNVLESARRLTRPCVVVIVTTDKCYENREWVHSYREEDAMGGYDPYSASKGCAELITSSYRRSFFSTPNQTKLASARAGNVIGGGDWADDRIVPDVFRALRRGEAISVRNKSATRPWQHVLEPLSGYLWLAACLDCATLSKYCVTELSSAFNFGPPLASNRTVSNVVESLLAHVGGNWIDASDPNARHEATRLNLSIDKAFHLLGWEPNWNYEETIRRTCDWYKGVQLGECAIKLTDSQITDFEAHAVAKKIGWAFSN